MRDEGRLAACHKQGTIDAEVASCSSYWSDEHRAVKSACPWSKDKGAADEVRAGDSEDSDSASDNRTVAALNTCDSTYADDSTGARSSGSTVHAGDRSPAYDPNGPVPSTPVVVPVPTTPNAPPSPRTAWLLPSPRTPIPLPAGHRPKTPTALARALRMLVPAHTGAKVVPCRPVQALRDFSYDAWKQDRRCGRQLSSTEPGYALG